MATRHRARLDQAGQARSARRHLRIDRRAQVLPRSFYQSRRVVKFCSHCGSSQLEFRVPDGDTLKRHVCAVCATIHYQNPKVVVGCLPVWED
ncbi:MAG: NUDIX hydrolase, partial [Betaproteobacteria bacterium]